LYNVVTKFLFILVYTSLIFLYSSEILHDGINTTIQNKKKTSNKNICDIGAVAVIHKAAPGDGILNIKPFNAI